MKRNIALFIIVVGILLAAAHWLFCLMPNPTEQDIWLPPNAKIEQNAIEVRPSGTVVVKKLNDEFKKRFGGNGKITVIATNRSVYYLAKEEGLTYVATLVAPSIPFKPLVSIKILEEDSKIQLQYRPIAWGIPFGITVPILLVCLGLYVAPASKSKKD